MDLLQSRLKFHELLKDVLGSNNVYFQPPESLRMEYPALVYTRQLIDPRHANNLPYSLEYKYQVTHIDRDPDSDTPRKLALLAKSRHERQFKADNLNHNVFIIYF